METEVVTEGKEQAEEKVGPKLPTKNFMGGNELCCGCFYAHVYSEFGSAGQTVGGVTCLRFPEVQRKRLNDWCGEHVDRELPQLEPGRIEEVREFRVGRKRAKKRSR